MRARRVLATATSLALLAPAGVAVRSLVASGPSTTTDNVEQTARDAYGNLPLGFQANRGQTDPAVKFLAQSANSTLFLTADEAVLSLTSPVSGQGSESGPAPSAVLRTRLLGADAKAEVAGRQMLPGKVNHFSGSDPSRWITNVPTYAKVAYSEVYPGIDLEYYGKQGEVEYDFVVAPGADPGAIRLGIEGAQTLAVDAKGDLVAQTTVGEVRQHKPVLYQRVDGKRTPVDGHFVLGPGDQVGFSVGRYDKSLPLVIDPVITYSTWIGGSGADVGFGLDVHTDGTVVIAGETSSTNFPVVGGVSSNQDRGDAFVTKLNAAGSALVYSTYLGGDRDDFAHEVALDANGNAYLTGGTVSADDPETTATEDGFPTVNAYDSTCGTDGSCNARLHAASSTCTTCPTMGMWDAFVTRLSSDGATIQYSTYLGGSDQENNAQGIAFPGYAGIAVDGTTAVVGGYTGSWDFPTTTGAEQTTCGTSGISGCDNNNGDGFVTVIDTSQSGGSSFVYSQFLGGSGHEEVRSVAIDDDDNVWVTGTTYATAAGTNNFPTTASAYQTTYQGGKSDAFVVKIKHTDSAPKVKYSTYLGGGGFDVAWGIAVDSDKEATVTGWTNSGDDPATGGADGPTPYFPTTGGAYDTSFNGEATLATFPPLFYDGDAFVSRVSSNGTSLAWSTFLGGTFMDVATSVALDSDQNAYVTGYTTCRNNNGGVPLPPGQNPPAACTGTFPMQSAIDSTIDGTFINYENHNAPTDVFVAKLSASGASLSFSTYLGGRDFDRGFAIAVRDRNAQGGVIDTEVYVTGRMASDNYPTTVGSYAATKPSANGNRDATVTKITL